MASVAQGITVQWNSISLGEVVSVSVDGISSDSVEVTPRASTIRFKAYSPADVDIGSVSVTARGATAMSATSVGLTAALSISGPGVSFSFPKAIFERLGWQASVGELQTYSVTFKLS